MKELGLDGSNLTGLVSGAAKEAADVPISDSKGPSSADDLLTNQREARAKPRAGGGKSAG